MIKEISIREAMKIFVDGGNVQVIDGDRIRKLDDIFAEFRFITDEETKKKEDGSSEGGSAERGEAEGRKPRTKKRTAAEPTSTSKEQEILKAWNGGERSIKEIMEITGASYPTVRKYIPENPEG